MTLQSCVTCQYRHVLRIKPIDQISSSRTRRKEIFSHCYGIPTNRNTSTKVTEKLCKYKDIEIEIWRIKDTTILAVTGALGLILRKGWSKIPGDFKTQELQKITLHILRQHWMYSLALFVLLSNMSTYLALF